MKKTYNYGGRFYSFDDVHMEAGMLYGRCITDSDYGKWAWLYPYGFQIEGKKSVDATDVTYIEHDAIPHGCHYWGGELRNNALWRAKW